MCGIIGIIGSRPVTALLVEALRRLEYRGYDSAGVAVLSERDGIDRRRAPGKLNNLESVLVQSPLHGTVGIGHTRWATHGVPSEANAHPHSDGKVAVVHNGIIENFRALKTELEGRGDAFESQTDTEAVVHLISAYLDDGMSPEQAVAAALPHLHGAFALGILFADHPDILIAARKGSPLAIGIGDGELYLGSDALALAPLTNRLVYLEEGDWAVLRRDVFTIYNADNRHVVREEQLSSVSGAMIGKGDYRHFMLKEIHEQPQVVGDTLRAHMNPATRTITLPGLGADLSQVERLSIVACGTSYYAGLVGKYWVERFARVPVEIDVASEYRYREPVLAPGGMALLISQSGETADTLACLRYAKAQQQHTVAVVNVSESTMAREANGVLPTLAGPEVGVASTKAFTTQLAVLACFAIALGRARGTLSAQDEAHLVHALTKVPEQMTEVLKSAQAFEALAEDLAEARDVLYLGRGTAYPIALEGALKLKEISYIHAEGYAAGEMKHGPIALIDDLVPVVVVAPGDAVLDKTLSNMQEVIARGGKVILLTDAAGQQMADQALHTVLMPSVDPLVTPLLYALPVQLLAYHTAVLKGTDVDQPRNLAKSVTVE